MAPSVTRPEAGSVRSVDRALDLLSVLGASSRPMGVTELGRATGMPKPTALRLLGVLERRDFVRKENARYQLGVGVVSLSRAFLSGNSLTRSALPILEGLSLLSGETSCLYVRQGFERVVVQRVEGAHSLRYSIRTGQRLPLYVGAAGLVLAAAMPDEDIEGLLDQHPVIRLANGEERTKDQLLARLKEVRLAGVAISRQERELGVVSVASPVARSGGEVIAAVAVLGPPDRMTEERVEMLSAEVRRAGREIGEAYSRF